MFVHYCVITMYMQPLPGFGYSGSGSFNEPEQVIDADKLADGMYGLITNIRTYVNVIHICNYINVRRCDLPDMYAQTLGHTAPKCKCRHIRQITTAHVPCYVTLYR